jgi:hypothetical protein
MKREQNVTKKININGPTGNIATRISRWILKATFVNMFTDVKENTKQWQNRWGISTKNWKPVEKIKWRF